MASAAFVCAVLAGSPAALPTPCAAMGQVAPVACEVGLLGIWAILPSHFAAVISVREVYAEVFHRYALSRVVLLDYELRDNVSYGPWEAPPELGAREANDDGLITEWAERYYVAHDWSSYGQLIRQMIPGDVVTINEQNVMVEDVFDYPRDAYLEEIREILGEEALVLQTCEPGTPNNRIVSCTQI